MIKREVIDSIESASRIEEVVGDFVHLSKRGVNYIGLCPFHNEKTPSFIVSPAKGIYKCFGCGKAGGSIQFIMEHEHYSYGEALRYLAKKYGIEIEETELSPEAVQQMNERESLLSVTEFANTFFIDNLWNTDEGRKIGLSYFHERGFHDETIRKFQLGFSLTRRTALMDAALKKGYVMENLEKAGLVTDVHYAEGEKKQDRFFDRVMFPIQNFSGRVIAFGGRTLHTADKKLAKYVNSPETDIYHKSDTLYGLYQAKNAIRKEDKCFLVEGYADVISMHQAGIENVVASSGTSLTANQVKLIRKLTNDVTVIYDGDNAGIHAAERAVGMMLKEGLNIRIVLLPPEDDPDTFARAHSLQEIKDYITENEKDFLRFRITRFMQQPDHTDPLKKGAFVNAVAADIALIPDAVVMSVFTKESSELLEIPENILLSAVNKIRTHNYLEEKKKSQGRPEQEPSIAEETELLLKDRIPAQEKIQTAGKLTFADIEKDIVSRLINYGDKILRMETDESDGYQSIRVDEFIFNDLDNEELFLRTPEYKQLYTLYRECFQKDKQTVVQQMRACPDEKVKALIASLMDIRPATSSDWGKWKNYIQTIDDEDTSLLKSDVIKVLQTYRLLELHQLRDECMSHLKEKNPEDEIKWLENMHSINRLIADIEKILGVVYR